MEDSRKILWANISLLMKQKYGEENLWRCARESKVGPATMTRIKEQQTSIGIDTLEKLAHLFRVEPFEMLMPGMDIQKFVLFQAIPNLDAKEFGLLQDIRAMPPEMRETLFMFGRTLAAQGGKASAIPAHIARRRTPVDGSTQAKFNIDDVAVAPEEAAKKGRKSKKGA